MLVWKRASVEKNHVRGLGYLKSPKISVMAYNHGDITFKEWAGKYLGEAVLLASNKDENNRFVRSIRPQDYEVYYIMGDSTNDDSGCPILVLWEFSSKAKSQIKPHQEELSEIHVQQLCLFTYTPTKVFACGNLCYVE